MKLYLAFLLLTISLTCQAQVIKVLATSEQQIGSIDFFHHLLARALDVSQDRYGDYQFEYRQFNFSQNRSLKMLENGELDVMHSMTNSNREKQFLAVKFPLVKGLMGHRVLVIHKKNSAVFENITQSELAKKIACQGLHWPDSDILEANKFTVARILSFEAMYEMVAKGRCDYFPRSILEIDSELVRFSKLYPELTSAKNVMLIYPAPVYFFVAKSNFALAKRLQDGLTQLEKSGEIEKILTQQPLTKPIFPLHKWKNARQIHLINPDLNSSIKSIIPTDH
ncbi:transporter substrate-binding domain-containing protein [Psychrosphaera aquimarina]|uniref:Transporter substrate-binding domain-containing protein n=1 Tax=Psychrosphaera aquimarina TaxID=2044854 RepID=A0ABU3R1Z7_9GAMM|nr:transporter substrate-binding domain-containing protein [Psychrosphaera aquimarina]MDU0113465.1 transporter substrate-binding domain-containing protein [Psychrosphaera aquimarina]